MLDHDEWDFRNVPASRLLECYQAEYEREMPDEALFFRLPSWQQSYRWEKRDEENIKEYMSRRANGGTSKLGEAQCRAAIEKKNASCQIDPRIDGGSGAVFQTHQGPAYGLYCGQQWAFRFALNLQVNTNKEIITQFARLVRELRRNLKVPGKRSPGKMKKSDLRARLRGIGLLRLRHAMSLSDMLTELRGHEYEQAWQGSRRREDVTRKLEEIRQQTLRWYRTFPGNRDSRGYPRSWSLFSLT